MLSAAELADARADLSELLWERCTIKRRQSNGTWATLGTDVPCRLTLSGSAVRGEGGVDASANPRASATLSLPVATDVGDRASVEDNLQAVIGGRRFHARLVVPREAFLMRVLGEVEG